MFAQNSQEAVIARARIALEDPNIPEDKKLFIQKMLNQMQGTNPSPKPALQPASPVASKISALQSERDKVQARAKAALSDPSLPAEVRQEIMGMLTELDAQAEAIGQLEAAGDAIHAQQPRPETNNELMNELASMQERCKQALANPNLTGPERAQVEQMQRDLAAQVAPS